MYLHFEHAAWGWTALAIVLAAIAAVLANRRSWRWRLAAILLPMAAAMLIASALARPHFAGPGSANHVVILLDLSDSTRQSPWRDPAWVRQLAGARLGANEKVTLVGFAAQPRLLLEDVSVGDARAWPVEWSPTMGSGTSSDLALGLAWRSPEELQSNEVLAPRWIITDGLVAGPAAITFPTAWTILPPEPLDVGISGLSVRSPKGPEAAKHLDVLVQIRIVGTLSASRDPTTRVAFRLSRDGKVIAEQTVTFTADPGQTRIDASRWISVPDSLSQVALKQNHRYEATVRLTPSDPWPENDSASILWVPPDERRILIVGTTEAPGSELPKDAAYLPADAFTASASELAAEGWQTIILDNVPVEASSNASALSAAAAQSLDQFVRDTGGGLLILTRGNAFGPGHYADGGPAGELLENLSPVWSRPHTGKNLHVIFLLDASASMNEPAPADGGAAPDSKFKLLAQGVDRAAHLLSTDDRITVITFNNRAELLADGSPTATDAQLRTELAQVTPSGATNPDAALAQLTKALGQSADSQTQQLLLLVTDGEIPSMDISRWQSTLHPGAAKPADLAIIAPRSGADGTLNHLAAAVPNTTWLPTGDPRMWSLLLQRAIAERVTGLAISSPLPWQITGAAGFSATGIAAQWTTVWLKPESTLIAQGANAQPVAAIVQRGLGQTAAIAISADASAGYSALVTNLMNRLSAASGDRRFTLSASRDLGGGWRISADGLEDNHFLDGESLDATILESASDSNGEPTLLHLAQSAPGHYEGHIPASPHTTLTATIFGHDTGATSRLVGHLRMPAIETAEWPASVDQSLTMGRLPAGSVELPAALSDQAQWNPPAVAAINLAPALWLMAIIVALTALWSRR